MLTNAWTVQTILSKATEAFETAANLTCTPAFDAAEQPFLSPLALLGLQRRQGAYVLLPQPLACKHKSVFTCIDHGCTVWDTWVVMAEASVLLSEIPSVSCWHKQIHVLHAKMIRDVLSESNGKSCQSKTILFL